MPQLYNTLISTQREMRFPNNNLQDMNILIAGGCFPVQDNIKEKDMYHQIICKKMMEEYGIHLSIDILRYENIKNCLELIKNKAACGKPDLLLFHLRVEPVLPKVKIFNIYTDQAGRIKKTIRIFSKIIFKITEENRNSGNIASRKNMGKFHNFLRELNYFFGILAFNCITLKKEHLCLIRAIAEYCKSMDIEPIFTGPVSRPRSYFENMLSEQMDEFTGRLVWKNNRVYIRFLGLENERNEFLFCEDLIKVNEAGHRRIAELLLRQIAQLCNSRNSFLFPLSPDQELKRNK